MREKGKVEHMTMSKLDEEQGVPSSTESGTQEGRCNLKNFLNSIFLGHVNISIN